MMSDCISVYITRESVWYLLPSPAATESQLTYTQMPSDWPFVLPRPHFQISGMLSLVVRIIGAIMSNDPLPHRAGCIMAEPHSKEGPSASSSKLLEIPEWLHSNGIEYFTTPYLPGFQADIKTLYPLIIAGAYWAVQLILYGQVWMCQVCSLHWVPGHYANDVISHLTVHIHLQWRTDELWPSTVLINLAAFELYSLVFIISSRYW